MVRARHSVVPDISGLWRQPVVAHDDWRILRAAFGPSESLPYCHRPGVSTGGWPRLASARTATKSLPHVSRAQALHSCRRWQPMFESRLQFSTGPAIPCASVTAQPSGSTVYLRHAQSPAPLLWRGILAFHHHSCYQRLLLLAVRGSAICFFECSNPQSGHAWRVLAPEQWEWSSFRHYAYSEPGPVMINEPQKAELRIRKIS